ncbi:hypothetical protein TRICI_001633 [Trichomonascus ciferrii]|uniref:Uncharacterized protein n=1 Tax=Trichomonascus ciferrii TaxID=44093 RepID=A0A642VAD0_9ASCO|nr:hypothetical protein TRICI_001633 [Trichomonascus ciferrii]
MLAMIPPLRFPDLSTFFEFPEPRFHTEEFSDEDEEDDDDYDDDEDDEMERIGRLPSLNQISLEYYHWLLNRYLGSLLHPTKESDDPPGAPDEGEEEHEDNEEEEDPPGELEEAATEEEEQEQERTAEGQSIASLTDLRRRIKQIKALQLPDRERDRRVQQLMTETYYKLHPPRSTQASVSARDTAPTFAAPGVLGCPHYRRRCKLECSTCGRWYSCRFCHDAAEAHKLVRPQTRHMLCMCCGRAQPAAHACSGCGAQMARYYCDRCKLWDDDPDKAIYHCDGCGICRIGRGLGIDFFHCDTCNMCLSIELQDNHRCIEHSTECDCPICGEFMFTSTETVVFMRCGHPIHQACYVEHTKSCYRCPTCARSVLNMEAQFRILDTEIANQPLPEPYSGWRSIVICNDCSAKSNTPFHFLGLKCQTCRSYNTAQIGLIKPEEGDDQDFSAASTHELDYSVDEATTLMHLASTDDIVDDDSNDSNALL